MLKFERINLKLLLSKDRNFLIEKEDIDQKMFALIAKIILKVVRYQG